MCILFNCILENVDFANFIVTSVLSLLLIGATIIISWRQNKLQKNINNQQNQLQRNITEREAKISLYQYRMNCYIQIMDALDIILYGKFEEYVVSFQTSGLEFIKKISDGRKMMLKAHIESETLFNEQIVTYIGELYNKYSTLYTKLCDVFMVSDEEKKNRKMLVMQKMGVTQNESVDNIFAKYITFSKTKEGMDFILEILPQLKDCLMLMYELNQVFKPNNELIGLMGKYLNVNELNKI